MSDLDPPTWLESLAAAALDGGADLVPVIGPVVRRLYVDSAKRQAAATGELIRQVAQDVGEELFTRAIQEDPRLRSLMLNAIEQCYQTSFEQKRWRYAEALRGGILDPAEIDNAIVELQVLRDVEVPHIKVLNALASIDLSRTGPYRAALEEYQKAWDEFPAPITAVLVNAGLAKELPAIFTMPPTAYRYTLVTPYGHKVLEDFRRLGMQLLPAERARREYPGNSS